MEQIVVRGIAERLLFEAPDSDYRVFRLHDEADDATYTVTGHGTKPLVGDRLEIKGHWVQHKRYGRQFAADGWSRIIPESVDGIERFLGSGAVKGLGPALAHRVVAAFGKDTMKILERDPQRLLEVEGIGPKKLAVITESFYEEKQVNDIAYDLEQHGVAGRYAGRLLQKYGDDVHYVLTEEPYRMIAEIDGIGFKTADQMALAYGMDRQDPQRLSAGLTYVLQTMTQNGHVCIPDAELVRRAAFILQADALGLHDILKEAIEVGQLCTADFQGTVYVYTPEAYEEENYIARRIQDMAAMKPLPMKTHVQLFLDRWQDSCHFELADKQREAVEKSLESGMTVITGGPGTGKTTVVQTIIRLAEQEGLRILLCAPTGRAAKRLAETTQRKAKTIHRLLIPDGRQGRIQVFEYNETKLLPADLVIVDEVSMLDMEMMYHLLSALKPQCRCILVGDADQLPSVGAGAVLHDIIASGQVPVVRLDTIFRQQEGGRIVTNAHLINSGRLPVVNEDPEFRFVEIEDEAQGAEKISALYNSELLETGDKFAVQVLSPMYKNPCGVDNLNQLIQGRFNPPAEGKGELKGKNVIFRVGDKVMQKHNDYEKGVFNGDIGEIFAIQKDMVYVRYPEQDVKYEGQEVDEITLAYAITVHKSQGSEYHTVIMVLVNSHAIMLQRNLFYTAVTRAKRKVILVGSKRAVQTAVQNQRTSRRFTLLIPRLQGELIV
ncbi:MAG: ATP-dependent RecD-like DNA helicase [Megasphaera elsdenii]|jgi:exodeoxyribonuclease V alpha subunit|nr:ATP-dependent RecD-like DNA helicase [Megasphaera elsdenii]MCI6750769.1 ATP-dependent RecD-like DNA helicase [Megasphaera elsdenii]MCI6924444.1 ATP-dependent RecD-like DNA helicase [Megasphaera elsdenii]MCI7049515.1 ATP-dependent RecD-like DNA helicase [Megasphaera elsdenii]MCI7667480.1 ATP-dependent RecD-like DNA helicase [Megasphaera elsdenii]MDD6860745.1 ATP-dependent RecD-like DNA helicase [Megasphaera elsdenii]